MSPPFSWADIAWHTINDRLDEDGRPLGEHASPEAYTRAQTDERPCPYADSRRGMTMNVSALRQVRRHWPTLSRTLRGWSPPAATVREAWMVTLAATIAPFCVDEAARVPGVWSALYKTCIGFNQILTFLMLAEPDAPDTPLRALASPDAFWTWLTREGWLMGQEQVCAGPKGLIIEAYRALSEGGGEEAPLARPADAVLAQAAGWQALTIAAVLRAQSIRGVGDTQAHCVRLLETSKAPWLSVVRLRAGWPADVAQRLVVDEKNRALVDRFLSHPHQTVHQIDAALKVAPGSFSR